MCVIMLIMTVDTDWCKSQLCACAVLSDTMLCGMRAAAASCIARQCWGSVVLVAALSDISPRQLGQASPGLLHPGYNSLITCVLWREFQRTLVRSINKTVCQWKTNMNLILILFLSVRNVSFLNSYNIHNRFIEKNHCHHCPSGLIPTTSYCKVIRS